MYLSSLNRIIIWKKQDNSYYYRIVKGHYSNYEIGYVNSYGHQIVLIIDNLEYRVRKKPLKNRVKKKIINFIEKI